MLFGAPSELLRAKVSEVVMHMLLSSLMIMSVGIRSLFLSVDGMMSYLSSLNGADNVEERSGRLLDNRLGNPASRQVSITSL